MVIGIVREPPEESKPTKPKKPRGGEEGTGQRSTQLGQERIGTLITLK